MFRGNCPLVVIDSRRNWEKSPMQFENIGKKLMKTKAIKFLFRVKNSLEKMVSIFHEELV